MKIRIYLQSNNQYTLAQYVDEGKRQAYFLDYFRVKNGTSEHLYKCFKYALNKHNLLAYNVIRIYNENANIM